MKKFFTIFFVTLGIIFFILIIIVGFFYFTNTNKPSVNHTEFVDVKNTETPASEVSTTTDKNPVLTPTQEKTLEKIGVDPAEVPTSFTPEQIQCFEEKLGKERVEEIKNGDTPTTIELIKGKECL